jgi:hypothetical protein
MHSVLMLGARQSIQCSAGEVLEQATCIRCSVLSGARALCTADCSQMISARQNPMQESWGGVGVQVIAQALPIWGINKQPNSESPSIPNATAPNLTDGARALAANRPAHSARCSEPHQALSAQCPMLWRRRGALNAQCPRKRRALSRYGRCALHRVWCGWLLAGQLCC